MNWKEIISCYVLSFAFAIFTGIIFAMASKNFEPLFWYIPLAGIVGGSCILGIIIGNGDNEKVVVSTLEDMR